MVNLSINQSINQSLIFCSAQYSQKWFRDAGFSYGWASKAILKRWVFSCDRKLSDDEAMRTWRGSEFQIWGATHEKLQPVITVLLSGIVNVWPSADRSKRTAYNIIANKLGQVQWLSNTHRTITQVSDFVTNTLTYRQTVQFTQVKLRAVVWTRM